MIYVLDGYNILFRTQFDEMPLEKVRTALLEELSTIASSLQLELIVIFDAHNTDEPLSRERFGKLEVIYTDPHQTADSFIIDYSRALSPSKKSQTTIISSDGYIRRSVRSENVRVLSVNQFFSELQQKIFSRYQKNYHEEKTKTLPPSLMDTETWEKLFTSGL